MATIDASIVIVAMPAIFRGIHLNPLTPGNVTYLLWMILGYLLVQSVLVVTLGRLGDMFGRVKIYNLGFVVFTLASVALSLDPLDGTHGAMWLIGWRFVQAFGGAMLMANAAAILTDAFPANKRGMALGVNQIAGISGQFVGLLLGGVLAAVNWRLVFCRTCRSGCSAPCGRTRACGRSPPPSARRSTGSRTSCSRWASELAADRHHQRHPALRRSRDRLDQPLDHRRAGRRHRDADRRHSSRPRSPSPCSTWACSRSGPSPRATRPACWPRSDAVGCSSC